MILSQINRTCFACPSQWDALDSEGNYVYMRYRYGKMKVYQGIGPDDSQKLSQMTIFADIDNDSDGELGGFISLKEFAEKCNITVSEQDILDDEKYVSYFMYYNVQDY